MTNRSKFIITTSADYFSVPPPSVSSTKDNHQHTINNVDEFLQNSDINILAATASNGKILFHHKIPSDEICLLFYKIPNIEANGRNRRQSSQNDGQLNQSSNNDNLKLGILTLEGGMVKSMYNSISRVFSPHNGSKRTEYTAEISGILENLQVSLNETLGLPQTGITNIQDEISFWDQKSLNSSTKSDREQAQSFALILGKLNQQINQIDQNSLGTIEEFLDSAHNNLDEIWRLPYHYPQNRMEDLMDIICSFMIDICVENLLIENIWNLSSYHVTNLISQAVDLTDSWMQLCDSLTRLFWPNYNQNPWIGEPHKPKRGILFKERLLEIRNIKNLYKQIVTLLNMQDIRELFTYHSPFKLINVFDTSSMGQMKWNKSLNQFEHMLQPIDEKIAIAIKAQLQNHFSNPRQVIFIFSKYDTLIQRPTVLDLLTTEREQFLQSLQLLLQDLRKAMNDTNMEPDTGHLSTICNECRWLKVVQYQIVEIEKVSHLISGREGFNKINQNVQELKEETETLLRTNFEIWSEQSLSAVKTGDLRLREDQNVVKFEREGRQLMQVTFNPKLVTFCQDVREFENLGYRVPIELRSVATHTAKFMSYARRLQQIATFHNTIGDRMIPCQRPIMLKNAIELSKLVQSESVAWNDEDSVQRYVSILQTAVSKLSADNNLLVGYHEQAKRVVVKLMNTDLLSQGQLWKDEMRHLRELVANLERQGYTNLEAFNLHWDHQLYKVLEYQYIFGLIDMNNKLPDIRIDLVFRQRQLQFRPAEEEIRLKYYTQLRRFIERPLGFRGLSENSNELFKMMVERNRHYFGPLFKKADQLFERLNELKNLWVPWVALGCVDIDELCNVHLNKWQDWDTNFKACKYFGQQIAKLQNSEESVDCFVINFLPLRSDIEFVNRRYWEGLASSLKISILSDISVIQEFLQTSLQFLQNVPMDEASITESGTRYEKIIQELPKINEILDAVKGKDTCLAGWCKERVSALASILNQWEKLQPLIENHSVVLQRQVDIMKDHLKTQIVNLTNEMDKFMMRWESTVNELENSENCNMDLFKERRDNWQAIKEKKEKLLTDCSMLNLEFPDEVLEIFRISALKIDNQSKQWEIYDEFLMEYQDILKEEWTIYRRRPYTFNEFLSKWESSVTSSLDLPSSRIRQIVQSCQDQLPVLQLLQSDALTERHWVKVCDLLKLPAKPMHTITLNDVLADASKLDQASNEIQNLVRKAASEQVVRQALAELDQWAVTSMFKLFTHSDSGGKAISLIKDYQDVLNKICDNQSLLQSAKNSAAFDSFSDQAEIWESRLNTLESLLSSLSQSQRKWIYLEPVFETGTLKAEEAIFKRLDKDFRFVMREIENDTRVISITKINNITTIIRSLEQQLSRCQNTLISYMIDKRNSFPRFYFLGDDDLLELLGQASKEDIIQKHIRKLFPGIQSLGFRKTDTNLAIEHIESAEGDIVYLKQSISITNSIEIWLNNLIDSIQKTLKEQIAQCCQTAHKHFDESILMKYPIQVLSTARAINFTKQTEKSITSMALSKYLKNLNEEIANICQIKNQTINKLTQLKCKNLLLDLVHYINVIENLIKENCTNLGDWLWLQQIKFYIDKDSKVKIQMVYAEFEYSYEFLGNPNKLVHTSLTHRCNLTLTQAMHMGLGGNPFGPAGTGKTECVKALGTMMGRLVLVFNCDENVDTEAMRLILTGLVLCGAWGCFDEFNRLQESTLSAISMIIQPIQTALKDKQDIVHIQNKNIKLNHHCGIFVTLNPAGEGYGGRQQLPGNIQALFRPIVMQQPEPKEIAKILLFIEGFQNAECVGNRIVELFDMNSKILSAQRHYDWGLRELKTVLIACGQEHQNQTNLEEELEIVVQVLRTNTMSKLNIIDVQRFDMLLKNVFPEIEMKPNRISDTFRKVQDSFEILHLFANDRQIQKTLQLHEQLTKRMGIVIVGPPQSGKTTIITLLKEALLANGQTIRTYTLSPKSISRTELLGKLDSDTRQWTDGVLTSIAISVNNEPAHITSWIICDGDIDPEWIEALNSVLDDNRLLTLPSGWRIQFGKNVNFIFETHNLAHASPATISRMGIVNMSCEDLPEKVIIESFLAKHKENEPELRGYIEEILPKVLKFIKLDPATISPLKEMTISIVKSILENVYNSQSKDEFCVKLMNSVLGLIPTEHQNEFANKLYEILDIYVSDPSTAEYSFYNLNRNSIEFYKSDLTNSNSVSSPLLPTVQVKYCMDRLRDFLQLGKPFLIVGPSGAGKTLLIQQVVSEFTGYQLIKINCSKQLTPNYILQVLKQNAITISGVRGREYKPQQIKIILFFKNIDLCNVDLWDSSNIIELIIQIIQFDGFYSENLEWISISGLQICGSLINLTKSIEKLSPRFLALNNYLGIKYPIEDDLRAIIQNRIEPILINFNNSSKLQNAVGCLMSFFNEIQHTFSIDQRIHYNFTPKMLVQMLESLQNYNENDFIEALMTEIISTFQYRLVGTNEIDKFREILYRNMKSMLLNFKENIYFIAKNPQIQLFSGISKEEWSESVKKAVTICNSETFQINLPITDEILNQCAIMTRIFVQSNTHVVLTSQPGCRAIDSLYITATLQSIKILIPQGIRNYSILEFNNDLKMAIQSSALEDQNTIFLIDHCWLTYLPEILKPIEAILEGIIDLFGDDLELLASALKSSAQLEGYQDSMSNYFLNRVKKNLHLVISMDSSDNNILENIFTNYPALYRNTNQMWLMNISKDTVENLPKTYMNLLTNHKIDIPPISSYFSSVIYSLPFKKTPRRFYQLIKSYYLIYNQFYVNINNKLNRLQIGVDKLAAAHQVVAELKTNAIGQEEKLAEKRKLANDALEMISDTMRNANDQKTDMLELKKNTQESSHKLKEREKAIAEELSEVEPILREASAAVGQIKTEALAEIRSLRAPPDTIRDILEGVLRLMGTRDTSWNSMKSFLAKRGVKEDIKSLDPSRISVENCEAVEKLLEQKADSFELRNAKRASIAAAPLATWVIANVRYSKVIQSIKPLEKEQKELQRNLMSAENQIKSLMSGLDDVDTRVKELSRQLNVYTQEAAVLEIKMQEASQVLTSAEVLVQKLSSEYQTWTKQLQDSHQEKQTLDQKSFWISLTINYLSDQTYEKRQTLLANALNSNITTKQHLPPNIKSIENINITEYLITEQDQVIWEGMGLSRDSQSVEHAAILMKILELPYGDCPIPLILDPTETAFKWLHAYLHNNNKLFETISKNSDKISYSLELAIRFGKILIIQDAEDIIPPILQLIFARKYMKFNKKLLQVGNKLIDLHDDFKMILITKLHKIQIPSEVDTYFTQIHFTITLSGLTDQLMSTMIMFRKPELAERRTQLLQNEGKLLSQRNDLEHKLLGELTQAQGDILKNTDLLRTLNEMKESGKHIENSLKESLDVKMTLLDEYNQFKAFCTNAANFFICLNCNYDLAVSTFLKLYIDSLKYYQNTNTNSNMDLDEMKIYKYLIKITYQYMCRSTPKDNHLTLGLSICRHAFPDQIHSLEWELFVTNFIVSVDESKQIEPSHPAWLKRDQITKLNVLNSLLPEFYNKLELKNEQFWMNYLLLKEYTEIKISSISSFQKILITQIFRPDFLPIAINNFVTLLIGIRPESVIQATIQQLSEESNSLRPILMITQTGNDPSSEIQGYAYRKFGKESYTEVSIGQGNEMEILDKMKSAAKNGQWICIKNLHLMPLLIGKIDRELNIMEKTNENFRLWIVSDSIRNLPETILYKYLRVFYESPNGVKNKLRRLLQQWDNLLLQSSAAGAVASSAVPNDNKMLKLIVIFFLLHAILEERRKYIPQGWSKFYEFSDADIRSGFEILITFRKKFLSSKIDWIILHGLFDIIVYGGRINSSMDLQILQRHLEEFFNDEIMTNQWSPLRFNVKIPTYNRLQDYYEIIQNFPDSDQPEKFGLSPSSDIYRNITFSKGLIQTLRSAFYKEKDESSNDDHETLEKRIRPILGLWKKLASGTTIEETANEIQHIQSSAKPWQDFLILEMKIAGKLFKTVHSTLVGIHAALKVSKVSDEQNPLKSQILNLSENNVPSNWKCIWPGPKTAIDYLKALIIRCLETEKRYKSQFHLDFCDEIDLSKIFNTSIFFAALKLSNAEQLAKSSFDLILSASVVKIRGPNVVKIAPLMIDGACFVNGKLEIFNRLSDEDNKSPEFYLTYIENQPVNATSTDLKNNFNLPLYSNNSRDVHICNLSVASNESKNSILMSGSALIVADNVM